MNINIIPYFNVIIFLYEYKELLSSMKNTCNVIIIQDKRLRSIKNTAKLIHQSYTDIRICRNFIHTTKNLPVMIMPCVKGNPRNPSSSVLSSRRAASCRVKLSNRGTIQGVSNLNIKTWRVCRWLIN